MPVPKLYVLERVDSIKIYPVVSFYLFQDFLRAWFTGTLHHPNLWHSVTNGHFLFWAGSQISNPAGGKSCDCQFTGLYNIININLSRAKRRAPFQPSFRALTWRAWCFRNEVSSPDAICFAPKGQGRFPGCKKKSFKLSRLVSFFAKEGSISFTLTVRSSLLVVKGCVHEVLWLSKTGCWRPDSVVRHPALLSLTVLSALFS